VLDTYEPERIAFARKLVATTDRVFQAASSPGRLAAVLRTQVVPRLAARAVATRVGQRLFFRVLSQTGIEYRASAWSAGHAGVVHAGDRLPWVAPAVAGAPDNFTPLRSLDWQVHVYGAASDAVRAGCKERRLPLQVLPSDPVATEAGFREGVIYLVRPDGYLGGVFEGSAAASSLARYIDEHAIRVR
jgi:hypothetical protein